jgi:hypothetical protein
MIGPNLGEAYLSASKNLGTSCLIPIPPDDFGYVLPKNLSYL